MPIAGGTLAPLAEGAEPPPGGRLFLCPLCEAKLFAALGKHRAAKSRARCAALARALEGCGLEADAQWARNRLAALDACGVCAPCEAVRD